ncbi:MAG: hypothetical protein Q9168_001955 [Polycauliona sp. 1 TL-2023]
MAFHPQPSYNLPHTDFDPAYGPTYPVSAQPYSQHPQLPQHQQQPPYHPSYHQPSHPHPAFSQHPHHLSDPHAQRSHHAPQQYNQQYQMPNPATGHGPPPPGSMPPPSSIPDSALYRQNYAYASTGPGTPDRWPLATTDDQRQMQEQYRQQGKQSYQGNEPALQAHQLTSITSSPAQTPQHRPNYLPQPSPVSHVTPGPVSSFPPTTQTRSPPHVQPPPQSPRTVNSPPSATSQPSQQPMTTTTAKTLPQSNSPFPTPTKDPVTPASSAPVSVSLESQRVSALLELNRVLIQEVVALQESHKESKTGPSASQPRQKPSPPPTNEASITATPQSKPDAVNPAKEVGETNSNTNDGTSTSATTKPTQPQPSQQQNKPPNSKEYIGYMRRLQANLAYLASIADRHNKPGNAGPQFPAIMEAPDTAEGGGEDNKAGKENMKVLYAKLRELWPDYVKGKANTPGGSAAGTAATTTTTTPISAPAATTTPTTAAAAA